MDKFILNITASSGEFYQGDCESLTLPTGLNRNGLPAALQLAAPSGCDEAVLAAGQAMARLLTGDAALNALRHPAH